MEKHVSNSEWYVLECLWDSAPKTLMQIVEECREKAGWAKSTTATMVKRMGEKGLIRYEEGGRAKLFYPMVKRENVAVRQTREFLQRIYHGSVGIMMNTLAKQDDLTEKDFQELEEFLEQCRKGNCNT
ncbi:MAG: BlaI/MecI/CopY family transcriptional regulator [Eubacterium sp.]|nr:BlaI/MecI/CopY family transcriptional regulator [Eubacterium sp.]